MKDRASFGAIRSIDYVILLCDDLEKMKAFYDEIFDPQIEDETLGTMDRLSFRNTVFRSSATWSSIWWTT